MLHELKDGIAYAWGFPPIRALLFLTATASLMFTSQTCSCRSWRTKFWAATSGRWDSSWELRDLGRFWEAFISLPAKHRRTGASSFWRDVGRSD